MTLPFKTCENTNISLALFVSEEGKEPRTIILDFFLLAEKVFFCLFVFLK